MRISDWSSDVCSSDLLGSNQPPTKPPVRADHFFQPQAKLGASLPLWGPEPGAPRPREDGDTMPDNFERPKGRLLLFWGCGAKAGPGTPVVNDFAKEIGRAACRDRVCQDG